MTDTKTKGQATVIAVYLDHASAEDAVRRLQQDGIPLPSISIVGKDFQAVDKPVGFVTTGTFANEGAKVGAWAGGIFRLLVGAAFLILPGVGPVIAFGPLPVALLRHVSAIGIAGGMLRIADRLRRAGELAIVAWHGTRLMADVLSKPVGYMTWTALVAARNAFSGPAPGRRTLMLQTCCMSVPLGALFTVNTMPEATLLAFADHGDLGPPLAAGDSDDVLAGVRRAGIDIDAPGAKSFVKSWNELMEVIIVVQEAPRCDGRVR